MGDDGLGTWNGEVNERSGGCRLRGIHGTPKFDFVWYWGGQVGRSSVVGAKGSRQGCRDKERYVGSHADERQRLEIKVWGCQAQGKQCRNLLDNGANGQ